MDNCPSLDWSVEVSTPKTQDSVVSDDANETLLELFREEVQSHTETLSQSLLRLEQSPTETDEIVAMMRAAHSIKGAARIVGVEPAVQVAHVM